MTADMIFDTTPDEHSEVTSVIRHKIQAGQQAAYEDWLREIVPVASHAPGHRGVNVIRPAMGSTEYTIVLHFDSIGNLRHWLDSGTRRALMEKVRPVLAGKDEIDIKTGLEFWFTPPAGRPAARPYKQFLATLSVIYPLSLVVPPVLAPVFARLPAIPAFIGHFAATAVIVGLVTYVVMPRYVPLIAKWLYR